MPKRSAAWGAVCLLAVFLGSLQAANLPRKAPEFAVSLTGGKQVLLSQYRGKVVAMLFILTYCPHCQKTVGALSKLQNELGPRGFQVVGSAIEDMAAMAVPDFIKRFNPPFPVGFNERDPVLQFLQHPPMMRLLMPQLVFIDNQGNIRAQYTGDDTFLAEADMERNLRAKVLELLNEGGPAQKKAPTRGAPKKK